MSIKQNNVEEFISLPQFGSAVTQPQFSLREQLERFWARFDQSCGASASGQPWQGENDNGNEAGCPELSPSKCTKNHKSGSSSVAAQKKRIRSVATPLNQRRKRISAARPIRQSDSSASGHRTIKQGKIELRENFLATRGKSRPHSHDSSTNSNDSSSDSSSNSDRKGRPSNSKVHRKEGTKWDVQHVQPDYSAVDVQQNLIIGKRRREVYCGNLAIGTVTQEILVQAFNKLFHALPAFRATYPDVSDPVRSMVFHTIGQGMFAFVEFFDEVLANTAIMMSGFELCGRAVKVGRPQGFVPAPTGDLLPLDVEPLRQWGLLPLMPEVVSCVGTNAMVANKLRELYFGNLQVGTVNESIMMELLTPACVLLSEYNPNLGPPVTKVTMSSNGTYCFVQFQNAEMVPRVVTIFNDTELFGRRLKVGRPLNLDSALMPQASALPPPVPSMTVERQVSPNSNNAFSAGVAAAANLSL